MLTLDLQDKRILEILARHCRVSHESIGKIVRLSPDAVSYRIKRLTELNVVRGHKLFIDARTLGFTRYHLLVKLSGSPRQRKDICRLIAQHPFVMWINSFIGTFDYQIILDARDSFHLDSVLTEIIACCRGTLIDYTVLTHLEDFEFTQVPPLLDLRTSIPVDKKILDKRLLRTGFGVTLEFNRAQIKPLDIRILSVLASDPCINLSALSEKVGSDRITVRTRTKKMLSEGVILSMAADLNNSLLGYVTYYLLVRVQQGISPEKLRRDAKKVRGVFYSGRMIGDWDAIFYINAQNPAQLSQYVDTLRQSMGGYIQKYEVLIQEDVLHWEQFSKGIKEALTQRSLS